MQVINPRTRACGWCNGETGNIAPLCWGCGRWALVFDDENGNLYALPFERKPSLTEVLCALVNYHEEVRRYEAAA